MATGVRRFEDLVAWQRARVLTREVYAQTRMDGFSRDFGLSNQIQRSATSVMANIAEGFGRMSRKEFAQFVSIAMGSVMEVRSHLYVALDAGYLEEPAFDRLSALASETSRLVGALRSSLMEARPPSSSE